MRQVCLFAALAFFAGRPATASISSEMIVEMREIMSVSVSPTGLLSVVGILHSNPRTNKRELSWVIVPLREGARQTTVPAGEEIFDPNAPAALLTRPVLWSRDGWWFFYLRRDGEEVQLWETRADGRITRQVTHSKSDLIELKRSSDPDKFIVQLAPDRAALRKAEEDENHSGILYDDHVVGELSLTKTLPVIDRWRNLRRTDSGKFVIPGWSGQTGAVFDVPLLKLRADAGTMPTAFAESENAPGRVTVVAVGPIPEDPYDNGYGGQYTLQLKPKTGGNPIQKCAIAECIANRITVIGWSPDGAEIYYLADSIQGPMGSRFSGGAAIYAWNPGRNVVRLIHDSASDGLWGRLYNLRGLVGLSLEPSLLAGREIVAAFEGVDQPPRLEAINLDTGVARILFDPNAELRSLTQGRAMRHTWKTSTGYSGRGIMVLPDGYQSAEKYPTVITTYSCRDGFLRGGGADNAPEFVLAHQGFIAVCVDVQVREILTHETDQGRIYPIYCDIVSGLIADLTKEGMLDPARVGLTGQSLGANAGAYCISHSNAIAAAAFRHGSFPEPVAWEVSAAWERGPKGVFRQLQLPDPRNDPTGRWDQLSVSRRAGQINTPTLIQTDVAGGYPSALTLWSAMRNEGKPIELHVFPDDAHQLIQPIHRLVNYERQMDWFKFWLLHQEDTAPSKRDQYDRWNRLRELTGDSQPKH